MYPFSSRDVHAPVYFLFAHRLPPLLLRLGCGCSHVRVARGRLFLCPRPPQSMLE